MSGSMSGTPGKGGVLPQAPPSPTEATPAAGAAPAGPPQDPRRPPPLPLPPQTPGPPRARQGPGPLPVVLAREPGAGLVAPLTYVVCTPCYRAPEVIMSHGRYTAALDLWSLGCVFGEVLQRVPYLGKASNPQQQVAQQGGSRPWGCSQGRAHDRVHGLSHLPAVVHLPQVAPVIAVTGLPITPKEGERFLAGPGNPNTRAVGSSAAGQGGEGWQWAWVALGACPPLLPVCLREMVCPYHWLLPALRPQELAALFVVTGTPTWGTIEAIRHPAWREYLRGLPGVAPTLHARFRIAG